jgi:hypothetical protein
MSEVDALFELLSHAPPRERALVQRVAFEGLSLEAVAQLYDVDLPRAKVLVFRALQTVAGRAPLSDEAEAAVIDRPESEAAALLARLKTHRVELQARLEKAAVAFAQSPDRVRDEWVRRLAIVVVLALTAFFYWREQNKPRPPPEKRPTVQPTSP